MLHEKWFFSKILTISQANFDKNFYIFTEFESETTPSEYRWPKLKFWPTVKTITEILWLKGISSKWFWHIIFTGCSLSKRISTEILMRKIDFDQNFYGRERSIKIDVAGFVSDKIWRLLRNILIDSIKILTEIPRRNPSKSPSDRLFDG